MMRMGGTLKQLLDDFDDMSSLMGVAPMRRWGSLFDRFGLDDPISTR